jgi:hypothetical protein
VAATPDTGTTALNLVLFSDVYVPHTLTENDYANLQILELPALPAFDLLGTPTSTSTARLIVHHSSYTSAWSGPPQSQHVLIDGLLNGWVITEKTQALSIDYLPSNQLIAAFGVSVVAATLALGLFVSLTRGRFKAAVTHPKQTGVWRASRRDTRPR